MALVMLTEPGKPCTVLVTGGAGFIGSHLVRALLAASCGEVRALDSLQYGQWENVTQPIAEQTTLTRFKPLTLDLTQATDAELQAALSGVDYLFHLAAEKYNQSADSPERVITCNVDATFRLFQAAARQGVKKVIFTSSLYAYGSLYAPAMEETQLPAPWTVYGISKLTGEHWLRHFYQTQGLAYTVLRLFFTYGPRQFAGMGYKSVILKNFERLLRGESPVIYGDGQQALDYVFVDDVVAALLQSIAPQADGQVLNIGSGQACTVLELTEHMQAVAQTRLPLQFSPPDWTAGTSRCGNPNAAQRILGWRAQTDLHTGLTAVYQWLQQQAISERFPQSTPGKVK